MKYYKVHYSNHTVGFMSPTDISIRTGLTIDEVNELYSNAQYTEYPQPISNSLIPMRNAPIIKLKMMDNLLNEK